MEDMMAKPEKNRKVVYTIIEKPGLKKSIWMKIGIAWENQDQSWNVYLDALPLNGKMQIREESERPSRYGNKEAPGLPAQQPFDLGGSIQ